MLKEPLTFNIQSSTMKRYAGLSGDAGVYAFSSGKDYILVQFADRSLYRYDYKTPGKVHVENMKKLAEKGRGLTTYINKYVRENYAGKENVK
jgi:hypothetical protein